MADFNDLDAFIRHLHTLPAAVKVAEHRGLTVGAEMVQREAKSIIGQEEVSQAGPFQAWAPLAPSTVEEKTALGYTGRISATDPLYRTGELRASITHKVEGHTAVVGSDDPVAEYQEFGTARIPPRSFLGRAAFVESAAIVNQLGTRVAWAIRGLRRND